MTFFAIFIWIMGTCLHFQMPYKTNGFVGLNIFLQTTYQHIHTQSGHLNTFFPTFSPAFWFEFLLSFNTGFEIFFSQITPSHSK